MAIEKIFSTQAILIPVLVLRIQEHRDSSLHNCLSSDNEEAKNKNPAEMDRSAGSCRSNPTFLLRKLSY